MKTLGSRELFVFLLVIVLLFGFSFSLKVDAVMHCSSD